MPRHDAHLCRSHDRPPLVAIVGAGQLAKMICTCALRMGLRVRCLAARPDDPACDVGEILIGSHDDATILRELGRGATVVTFDHERADPVVLARALSELTVWPSPATLAAITDKREQRRRLAGAAIPQPVHTCARDLEEASSFASSMGTTVVLKRGRGGYDGYGVRTIADRDALASAFASFDDGDGVLVEQFVPFVRELAVCVVRSSDGSMVSYPSVECGSERHACAWVVAPARGPELDERARAIAMAAIREFDCVGAATVELFELGDGELLVNEVSPRVHNTAHWTIEGANTSQYENHLRAILGWPLGDTGLRHDAVAMANVFGTDERRDPRERIADALAQPRIAVHLYGKPDVRPGRKLGHVTSWGEDAAEVLHRARAAAASLMGQVPDRQL